MVLTLKQLCVSRVCTYIINGIRMNNIDGVLLTIHEEIMSGIKNRLQLMNSNCLEYLQQPSVLGAGFNKIILDSNWVARNMAENTVVNFEFTKFLANYFELRPHLAQNITTIRAVCEEDVASEEESVEYTAGNCYIHCLKLLSCCPKLKCLSLHFSDMYTDDEQDFFFDSLATALVRAGATDFEELELVGLTSWTVFRPTEEQRRVLQRLKRLSFANCHLSGEALREILNCCQSTLSVLILKRTITDDDSTMVPVRLENVTHATVCLYNANQNLREVTENCPNLQSCELIIDWSCATPATVTAMDELLQRIKGVETSIEISKGDVDLFNRFLETAGHTITQLHQNYCAKLYLIDRTLDLFMTNCRDLRTFSSGCSNPRIACSFLTALFHDKSLASKLRRLSLKHCVNNKLLDLLFKNCCNLDDLSLSEENRVKDHHIKIWASTGVRPSEISFLCDGISDESMISLFINSKDNLRRVNVWNWQPQNVRNVVSVLFNNCPNLSFISIESAKEHYDQLSETLRGQVYARFGDQ